MKPGETLTINVVVDGFMVEWTPVGVATDVALPVLVGDSPAEGTIYELSDHTFLSVVRFPTPEP